MVTLSGAMSTAGIGRVLARMMTDRGVHLKRTYQLNTGGNTDFAWLASARR